MDVAPIDVAIPKSLAWSWQDQPRATPQPQCRATFCTMGLILFAFIQASTAQAASITPLDFDLKTYVSASPCGSNSPDQIIVCGSRAQPQRLRPVEHPELEPEHIRAAAKIGKATISVDVSQEQIGSGAVSQRAMIGVKLPF